MVEELLCLRVRSTALLHADFPYVQKLTPWPVCLSQKELKVLSDVFVVHHPLDDEIGPSWPESTSRYAVQVTGHEHLGLEGGMRHVVCDKRDGISRCFLEDFRNDHGRNHGDFWMSSQVVLIFQPDFPLRSKRKSADWRKDSRTYPDCF